MKAIINGKILLPDGEVCGRALLFEDKIIGLVNSIPAGCEVIDAKGLYVSPGFVDVHIHGYLGEDASDGSAAGLARMAQGVMQNGVTSFLPTTMTVEWPQLEGAFAAIRTLMQQSADASFVGAQVIGCHAEGPFINPARKGAQKESAILPPDASRLAPWQDVVRLVTLAPEMDGAMDCIRALRQMDVRVSLGHTDASYDVAMAALNAGADHFTHTFNAMSPLSHRAPGTVGAALTGDAYCELIADGFHIHPGLFALMHRAKGDKLVLITDCVRAGGLTDGKYDLGGQEITVQGVKCRLQDGTIAGSVLKMNNAVRLLRDAAHLPLHAAVHAAALAPARSIDMDHIKGSLQNGRDADILFIDENVRIHAAYIRGVKKI